MLKYKDNFNQLTMQTEQKKWTSEKGWEAVSTEVLEEKPQLVLVFGGSSKIEDPNTFIEINAMYPGSHILLASTAGEIIGTEVLDESISVTAIHFKNTPLSFVKKNISDPSQSMEVGSALAQELDKEDLKHVMVFSDGMKVNGTGLVDGLKSFLPADVSVTGGLVADGARFEKTFVGIDEPAKEGQVVLIGFYGKALKIGYGSVGGWDTFGPDRMITKSKDNVLYELDGKPALALYKEYLGDQAAGLPGTGLQFPMTLHLPSDVEGEASVDVVRTILGVNEADQSMTFAGNMPEGTTAKLMKANFERLIEGAAGAADMSISRSGNGKAELAILISCVGRKLVLKNRIEEEVEAVQSILGPDAKLCGFYSYGEISPVAAQEKQCQLQNQTMTITVFREQ